MRPWRHQSGRLRDAQIERAAETLRGRPESALRIVALHHHLLGAPWRSRKKPVAQRNRVLAGLVEAGADLILAGHIHQSTVAERREFELSTPEGEHARRRLDRARASASPGRTAAARRAASTSTRSRRGALRILTYIWREDGWGLTAVRRFPRGREPLASSAWLESPG